MTKEFLEKLKEIEKNYFTLSDLEKIWTGGKATLKVILSRLVKKNKLKRVFKNVYVFPERAIDIEK